MTRFFDMNLSEGRDVFTAEAMVQSIYRLFTAHSTRWNNCMASGLDNTNANIVDHNSIKKEQRLKSEA